MAAKTKSRQSPASIRILAEQLASNATLLRSAAEGMEALGETEMVVTHDNSRKIGWDGVDAYVRAVRDAIRGVGTKPVEEKIPPKKRIRSADTSTGK